MHDADLSHLGSENYFESIALLKKELEEIKGKKIKKTAWIAGNIEFINDNPFYTEFALSEWEAMREKNLNKLKDSLEELKGIKNKNNKKDTKNFGRGVETMLRITSTNHIRLSSMADNKAHIMISVNTLLITLIISQMLKKMDVHSNMLIPCIIIIIVSLVTIILATIVTIPQVTSGIFNTEDVKKKKINLLFFGNFFNMQEDDFKEGMNEMLHDSDYLYGSMITDFYNLGKVLGRKYKYLKICYNFFMYGMILSVLSFIIAVLLSPAVNQIPGMGD
jgi:hypothetical protein